jgi:hypothetical protein
MGYDFLLTAKDDAGNASDATVSATTLAGSEIFFDDMESGSAKWTANAPWAITTETPHSSSRSWSDSPFGIYSNSGDASIVSTSFSLVGTSSPKLSFWTRYGLETNFDFGYVYVSPNGGSTWTELARLTGASAFKPVVLDLAAYTSSSNVRLRFRMKSDSFVGAEGWYMDDVLVSAADTTAPAAPQGLVATAGDRQVFLDWVDNTEPDLDSYRVSRTTDAPESPSRSWQQIASVSASTYTDAALANGTTYYYRVSAVDLDGNESPPSAESSAQPSTRIQTYAASSVTIAKGASLGDAVSNLADSDDRYFRVDSARKGAKWDVDWYGSATIDPAGAKKLTVTYEGSWTASVTQQLYVWDFSTSSWQRFASQTVSTSDIGSTWSTLTPARHISAQGEVRLRVTIQKPTDARVTVRGDQMRFTVEY